MQNPHVSLQGFVVGREELRYVVPDVKAAARAYWYSALENVGISRQSDEDYFEATWQEHGPAEDHT